MEIIWSENAYDSLRNIFDYIKPDSIRAARKIVDDIFSFSETFSFFPYKYPICQELESVYYRSAVFKKNYRLIYKITEKQIYILDVFHTSRNPILITKLKDMR